MCDGCENSFHSSCLDPPLDLGELNDENQWFCRVCIQSQSRKSRPKNVFDQLVFNCDTHNPKSYLLPSSIRNYFNGGQSFFKKNFNLKIHFKIPQLKRLQMDRIARQLKVNLLKLSMFFFKKCYNISLFIFVS